MAQVGGERITKKSGVVRSMWSGLGWLVWSGVGGRAGWAEWVAVTAETLTVRRGSSPLMYTGPPATCLVLSPGPFTWPLHLGPLIWSFHLANALVPIPGPFQLAPFTRNVILAHPALDPRRPLTRYSFHSP